VSSAKCVSVGKKSWAELIVTFEHDVSDVERRIRIRPILQRPYKITNVVIKSVVGKH
jgi:hypothetical protein